LTESTLIYRVLSDAVIVAEAFSKKTRDATAMIEVCQRRLRQH
jgi:hypothetical protein